MLAITGNPVLLVPLDAIAYLQRDALVTAADAHTWLDERKPAHA
jgi:hypothetical protein